MNKSSNAAFVAEIATYVRTSLLSFVGESKGVTSAYGCRAGMILTPEAEVERDDFNRSYDGGGCSCHLSPPCSFCTDPGNPSNQEEDDYCWIPALTGGAA